MKTTYEDDHRRAAIAEMIKQVQEDNRDIISSMPDKAFTIAQMELQKKHGTPKEFAEALVAAIGEISPLEAHTAIRDYLMQWNAASGPM